MSTQPVEHLELRALEQRKEIHQTADQLRTKIALVRRKFSVSRNLREHAVAIALIAGGVGLALTAVVVRIVKNR